MSLLKLVNVSKSYSNNKVFEDISLEVNQGEVIVIIGPSGTGKSTLLRCVNRLTNPDKGEIWLNDVNLNDPKTNINEMRQQIGFLFQNFNLFNHLTSKKNVMVGLTKVKGMKKKEAEKKALHELDRLGMKDWADHYPTQLSGGQKQRIAISRALALDPKLMLFDEPTSALDPELINEVLDAIKILAKDGMTMIIVTHELSFARDVADRIIFMDGGKIVEQGPPREILYNPKNERTKKFFGRFSELNGESNNNNGKVNQNE